MTASAPAPSRRTAAILFILVTALLDVMSMGIVIPVLPQLIETLAGSNTAAGMWNGLFVALWAATRIEGGIIDHEIFWMSALGALNIGVIAAEASALVAASWGR